MTKHSTLPSLGAVTAVSFEDMLVGDAAEPITEIKHTDPLAISFTSGTTGPSKGVLATNCHVITFALDWITACQYDETDRLYTALPMFHAIATWLGVIPTLSPPANFPSQNNYRFPTSG